MIYLYIYIIIGFIIGAGTALHVRGLYNSAEPLRKILMHRKYGCGHWSFYLVMILSRIVIWPAYVVAEILTKTRK